MAYASSEDGVDLRANKPLKGAADLGDGKKEIEDEGVRSSTHWLIIEELGDFRY